jgi:hypothetical protein
MTRAASGDVVAVTPGATVYTALAAAGTLAVLVALIVLFMKANTMAPDWTKTLFTF